MTKKHIVKNTFFCVWVKLNVFPSCVCVHKMALQYHWHSFKSINMAIEGGATKLEKTPALNSKNQFEQFFPFCAQTLKEREKGNSVYLSNGKHVAYIECERQHNNNKENDLCKQFISFFCVSASSIQCTRQHFDCCWMRVNRLSFFPSTSMFYAMRVPRLLVCFKLKFNSKRSVVVLFSFGIRFGSLFFLSAFNCQ